MVGLLPCCVFHHKFCVCLLSVVPLHNLISAITSQQSVKNKPRSSSDVSDGATPYSPRHRRQRDRQHRQDFLTTQQAAQPIFLALAPPGRNHRGEYGSQYLRPVLSFRKCESPGLLGVERNFCAVHERRCGGGRGWAAAVRNAVSLRLVRCGGGRRLGDEGRTDHMYSHHCSTGDS